MLYVAISSLLEAAQYFSESMAFMALVLGEAAVTIAVAAGLAYAGIALWRVRPQAVQMARAALIIYGVYALLDPLAPLLLDLNSTARQQVFDGWLQTAGRAAMYSVIWLNYLMTSKRVRATYPDWNPPGADAAKVGPNAKWYHFVIALVAVAAIIAAAMWFTRQP